MEPPLFPGFDAERAEANARLAAEALADGLARMVQIAHALLRSERRIDLAGLDKLIGLLSARALDLRADHGRLLKPRLLGLLGDVHLLSIDLADEAPD